METLKIILLSVLAACAYGIVHDQVTARVCVEYFTIFHPPILNGTQSPTLLAFGWGIIATWWVGLPLGIILALAARLGGWPRRSARQLLGPLVVLLGIMGALAMVAGLCGFAMVQNHSAQAPEFVARTLPPQRHAVFMAAWWAHQSSYASGMLGGLVLSLYVVIRRFLQRRTTPMPPIASPCSR